MNKTLRTAVVTAVSLLMLAGTTSVVSADEPTAPDPATVVPPPVDPPTPDPLPTPPPPAADYPYYGGWGAIDSAYYFGGQVPVYYVRHGQTMKWQIVGQRVKFRYEQARTTSKKVGTKTVKTTTWKPGRYTSIGNAPANGLTSVPFRWPYRYSKGDQRFRLRITTLDGLSSTTTKAQVFRTVKGGYTPPTRFKGRWSLINTNDQRVPARFNPCSKITVRVDTRAIHRGSRKQALKDAKTALAYINKQTGLRLTYVGSTKSNDSETTGYSSANITITWAGSNTKPYVGAGWATVQGPGILPGARFMRMVKAKAVVVSRYDRDYTKRQRTLRHELMHAIGAGHSKNSHDLMHGGGTTAVFAAGDREVAKVLGSRAGCF